MYTLLSGLYNHVTQKDDYFVLILGLDNAGKTTFLESAKTKFTKDYNGIKPSKITATVGLNIGQIDLSLKFIHIIIATKKNRFNCSPCKS